MQRFLLFLSLCYLSFSLATQKIYQICVENAWTTQGGDWGGICCLGSLALLHGGPKSGDRLGGHVYSSKNNNTCPTLRFEDTTDVNLFIVELSPSPEKPNTWFGYDYLVWKNHPKGYFYWNVTLLE